MILLTKKKISPKNQSIRRSPQNLIIGKKTTALSQLDHLPKKLFSQQRSFTSPNIKQADPLKACNKIFSPPLRSGSGLKTPLKVAVKDVFDIENVPTHAGNPDFSQYKGIPQKHCPVVQKVLAQGHWIMCKTHTDELACSINGENPHFGTPQNRKAPSRIPGGSSSGSAVSVGYDWVDVALGTDTAGSCRIPAAYNGVFGFRSSTGSLDMTGVLPLAPTFDSVGWFARSAGEMVDFAKSILEPSAQRQLAEKPKIFVAKDLFLLADYPISKANFETLRSISYYDEIVETSMVSLWNQSCDHSEGFQGLSGLLEVSRILQEAEILKTHQPFLDTNPRLDPILAKKLKAFAENNHSESTISQMLNYRNRFSKNLNNYLQDHIMVFPTIPSAPPKLGQRQSKEYRQRIFQLVNVCSLAGIPCLSIPSYVSQDPENPKEEIWSGLSVASGQFTDISLLSYLSSFYGSFE